MGELARESDAADQEPQSSIQRDRSPYRPPPLSFASEPLSIGEDDSPSAGSSFADGTATRAGGAGRAAGAAMSADVLEHNPWAMPLPLSASSPILPSWSCAPLSPSAVSPPPPTSTASRTRSSSISSDRTQRAYKTRHGSGGVMNSCSSNASSASSLNTITPLASPLAYTGIASVAAASDFEEHPPTTTTEAGLDAEHADLRPTDRTNTCSPRLAQASPALADGVLQTRRHHQPQAAPALHYEQRRRSNSSSSAYSHGVVGGRALPPTSATSLRRNHQQHHHHHHQAHHLDTTISSPARPSRSLSLSSQPSAASLDAVNTLGLSYDQHLRSAGRIRDLDSSAVLASGLRRRTSSSASFVSVTSDNPIRAAHAFDEITRSGRHQASYQEEGEAATFEQKLHLPEADRQEHSQGDHIEGNRIPLSFATLSSQTFEAEQIHTLAQRKDLPIIPSTAVAHEQSLIQSSPSPDADAGRPDLPYRIPSFNPSEPFRAALPESLARLVILESPPSATATLEAEQTEQVLQEEEDEQILESPVELVESSGSSSPEGIATPPHSRHHQQDLTLHRLSTSLPASPTQATYTALFEALAGSRHLSSLRIPHLRASLNPSLPTGLGARLPLTPLEETNTPEMRLDSPADLVEPCNPFDVLALDEQFHKATHAKRDSFNDEQTTGEASDANETFYHTLLEFVQSESGYTADLTDLVEVHFSLLSIARFITEEQRAIIVRDATRLVDIHRRLQDKLRRVDEDLDWIREDTEEHDSDDIVLPSQVESDLASITTEEKITSAAYTLSSPESDQQYFPSNHLANTMKRTAIPTRKFRSSDATVLDAARRISAIFINESQDLSDAYQPFCSGHSEAMEVVKNLSTTGTKVEWDAFESQCTAHLASRRRKKASSFSFSSSSSRLHFADFLIKPVQRICRYPLLFASLLKNSQKTTLGRATFPQSMKRDEIYASISAMSWRSDASDIGKSIDRIREALDTAKLVASRVDHAQKLRSLEVATVKLARRIEVQTPAHVSLLNRLEQVILIGSAHVIYAHTPTIALQGAPTVLKAGFYGLVLYDSHLVFFKVKKTNVYEPRHWLPLRSFDLQKVADGEGTLPYAFRMICRDHTFEVGSLCHSEQDIWVEAIEHATSACRKQWLENLAKSSKAIDENLVCSLPLDSTTAMFEGVSPILTSSEFGVFPASPEPSKPSTLRAGPFLSLQEEAPPGLTPGFRARLSLKPPAQRVGVDLRLADLLSDSILSARAQAKRSHAMPLHGPPPRSMTAPHGLPQSMNRRPHSFHPASFSYRNLIDSTLSSRRTSLAESDGSRASTGMKQVLPTSASTATLPTLSQMDSSDTPRRKPTKLRRSRTSAQVSDQEATDATTKPQRRNSTLERIRRRATSLVSDTGPMKALEEIRLQEQTEQLLMPKTSVVNVSAQAGPIAIAVVPEQVILDASVQATVARNSSTSSSSSYASTSTDPSLGTSLETPQSSLPASPLLTPVDLETHSRWTKIGDALSHTLMRKRSFASQRPILSIPPEALLEGAQLEQAQNAAEFIYTGRNACGSNCSHGSGTHSAATSSHPYEKRYSWDREAWNNLTASGQTPRTSFQGHQRSTSGVSAPPSMSGGASSQRNIFGGRSAPDLSAMVDKRQASSGSLWSVFERNGDIHPVSKGSSSPAPSIYDDAHESEDSSAFPSPAAQFVPLPDIAETSGRVPVEDAPATDEEESIPVRVIPVTRINPLGCTIAPSLPASTSPVASTSSTLASLSPPPNATRAAETYDDTVPFHQGSLIKRKNSLSARLRAFRALGSGMTPVRQQQPSRTYLTR